MRVLGVLHSKIGRFGNFGGFSRRQHEQHTLTHQLTMALQWWSTILVQSPSVNSLDITSKIVSYNDGKDLEP